MYAEQSLWREAREEWQGQLPANPEDAVLQYNVGVAQEALRDRRAAQRCFEQALALDEQEIFVEALARSRGKDGRAASYGPCLEGSASTTGGWSPAYRGAVYARNGLWSEARSIWEPDCDERGVASSCFNLGVAAEAVGPRSSARAHYKRAMDLAPSPKYAGAMARIDDGKRIECEPPPIDDYEEDDEGTTPPPPPIRPDPVPCDSFTPGPTLEVAAPRANLRNGPSTDHAIVASASNGARLIEGQRTGNWICVDVDGSDARAWIYGNLTRPLKDDGPPPPPVPVGPKILTATPLRSRPSTLSPVLRSLPVGTVVQVLDEDTPGFIHVEVNGQQGYVAEGTVSEN